MTSSIAAQRAHRAPSNQQQPLNMANLSDTNELSEASFLTAVGGTPQRPSATAKTPHSFDGFVEDQPLCDETAPDGDEDEEEISSTPLAIHDPLDAHSLFEDTAPQRDESRNEPEISSVTLGQDKPCIELEQDAHENETQSGNSEDNNMGTQSPAANENTNVVLSPSSSDEELENEDAQSLSGAENSVQPSLVNNEIVVSLSPASTGKEVEEEEPNNEFVRDDESTSANDMCMDSALPEKCASNTIGSSPSRTDSQLEEGNESTSEKKSFIEPQLPTNLTLSPTPAVLSPSEKYVGNNGPMRGTETVTEDEGGMKLELPAVGASTVCAPSPRKASPRKAWRPPTSPRRSPPTTPSATDFARTYKLEPTIPGGPILETERRASLSSYATNTIRPSRAPPKDFAKTYKMVPTKPQSPTLQTERRASLASLIRRAEANADAVARGAGAACIARNRAASMDLASTYKCTPTVPKSPYLILSQRASPLSLSHVSATGTTGSSKARKEEVDLAKTYKLEPTKCFRPSFQTETRARLAQLLNPDERALKPSNGVVRRSAGNGKGEVDYAATYKLEPTRPKAPVFQTELRCPRSISMSSNITTRVKDEPDFAATYELKPTLPVPIHLSTESRFVKHSSMPLTSSTRTEEKKEQDYAASYKLEPTKPMSPRMSCFSRKHPMPRSAPAAASSSKVPFRAKPMPDFGELKVSKPARRTSVRNVSSPPEVKVEVKHVAPPLKPTIPTKHRLESEKRHEEYVARTRLSLARSSSHGSISSKSSKTKSEEAIILTRTKAEPFQLCSIARHDQAMEIWRAKVAEEEKELARRRNFKAKPLSADMLDGATFIPETGVAALTTPLDVVTASRNRALARARYDAHNAERVMEDEERRRQASAAREEQERLAVETRLRKNGFKARPVPETTYRRPDPVIMPRTPRHSVPVTENEKGNVEAASTGRESSKSLSPKEIIAGVRRAIERLSPGFGSPT